MATTGTATIDFGATPGTNVTTVTVNSAGVAANSHVEAFFMGTDSTAGTTGHNAYEHMLAAGYIRVVVTTITAGVSFVLTAYSELRIRGTFTVHWVYA